MSLSSGTRLGPYEILAPLGAGGMGEVYSARDTRLGREVAVKVLPASFSDDPDRLRRFELEAKAASALNHPNIVTLHDIGSHDGAPYVVSELLEGETLRSRLSTGALSPRKATEYAIQIAQGLAAAHEKGIVHRDLKPENLFVTEDGRVKILDFGLAKLMHPDAPAGQQTSVPTASQGTEPGVVMGTAGYMSPEQVKGQAADHRSDIFSFGAILYEMLSGRRAFKGDSAVETMSAILKEDPPDLSETDKNLSPGLQRLVRHCLEKAPSQRFQSARDMAYDLENQSGSSGRTIAVSSPPRSGRWLALAAAAALICLAGWLLYAYGTRTRSGPIHYRQLTFQRGYVSSARFAPDGRTVVYSAAWLGKPLGLFSVLPESPESRSLDMPSASLLGISRTGELALNLDPSLVSTPASPGTLARVPLSGGSPRSVLDRVSFADWSPKGELAIIHRARGKDVLELPPGHPLYESAGWISHPRIAPDGLQIAFIDHPLRTDIVGRVMTVDLQAKTRALGAEWFVIEGLAWSPDGSEVWFTACSSGTRRLLRAVTLSGQTRLLATAPTALKLEDTSASGGTLLTSESWKASMVGVAPGETLEREFTWLDFSWAIALSRDETQLLFQEWGEASGNGIYVRKLDGSAPTRLGDGLGLGFSPDGQWVLTMSYAASPKLVLLPIGPGEPRAVATGNLAIDEWAKFLPDGRRIAFLAHEPGQALRLFVTDLTNSTPRPVTPEGVYIDAWWDSISPDGREVVAFDAADRVTVYSLVGGEPQPLLGALPGDRPVRWSGDGRRVFVIRQDNASPTIFSIDRATGKRELWKKLTTSDVIGAGDDSLVLSADGKAYFWSHSRLLSELFFVEGVR